MEKCDSDTLYIPMEYSKSTCVNGKWDSSLKCEKSDDHCDPPAEVDRVKITCNDDDKIGVQGNKYREGTKCKFSCASGYISKSTEIQCANGKWTETVCDGGNTIIIYLLFFSWAPALVMSRYMVLLLVLSNKSGAL